MRRHRMLAVTLGARPYPAGTPLRLTAARVPAAFRSSLGFGRSGEVMLHQKMGQLTLCPANGDPGRTSPMGRTSPVQPYPTRATVPYLATERLGNSVLSCTVFRFWHVFVVGIEKLSAVKRVLLLTLHTLQIEITVLRGFKESCTGADIPGTLGWAAD